MQLIFSNDICILSFQPIMCPLYLPSSEIEKCFMSPIVQLLEINLIFREWWYNQRLLKIIPLFEFFKHETNPSLWITYEDFVGDQLKKESIKFFIQKRRCIGFSITSMSLFYMKIQIVPSHKYSRFCPAWDLWQ
jgi:hypothetical protein